MSSPIWRRVWENLPERYRNWKTTHKRFTCWAKTGGWERVFDSLTGDPDHQSLMLDTPLVWFHHVAAAARGNPSVPSRSRSFQRNISLARGVHTHIFLCTFETNQHPSSGFR